MAVYNPFECCHHCVPPKRQPACSDHCPEYAEAKIKYIVREALLNKDREAREYTNYLISKNVDNAAKKKKNWQRYHRRSGMN